jgi:hypothetical protein
VREESWPAKPSLPVAGQTGRAAGARNRLMPERHMEPAATPPAAADQFDGEPVTPSPGLTAALARLLRLLDRDPEAAARRASRPTRPHAERGGR